MAATSVAFFLLLLLPLTFLILLAPLNATTFNIVNQCSFTVWPAALTSSGSDGGGLLQSFVGSGIQLDSGETWTFDIAVGAINSPAVTSVRVWARTGCSFDAFGKGSCETGDCLGQLQCAIFGSPPTTLADFFIDQHSSLGFFGINLFEGYNVVLSFGPAMPSGNSSCRHIRCAAAEIIEQCPGQLTAPGGWNHPCPVFKTKSYCCLSKSCKSTWYSRFFKYFCPDVYSYLDQANMFSCPAVTDYNVTFCPMYIAISSSYVRLGNILFARCSSLPTSSLS